jgi:cell division control protein 7
MVEEEDEHSDEWHPNWPHARVTNPDGTEDGENEMRYDEEEEDEEEEEEDLDSGDSVVEDPKSEGEMRQIENEMYQLENTVPQIVEKYKLVDRLGEGESTTLSVSHTKSTHASCRRTGTFSSVYKAIDIQHSTFDNSEWKPIAPTGKVYVALKRIYVTSSPARIHNELEILYDLR